MREGGEIGRRYGLKLKDDPEEDSGLLSTVRGKVSELAGRLAGR